jgi:hypothetical protein
METHELRTKVDRKIGRSVPDAVWENVEDDWLDPARRRAQGALDDLVLEVRRLLRVYDAGPGITRLLAVQGRPVRGDLGRRRLLSPAERRRADVLANAVAGVARMDPELRFFRSHYLRGKLVAPNRVSQLISSVALQSVTMGRLADSRIPLLGHRAQLCRPLPPAEGGISVPAVEVSWPGGHALVQSVGAARRTPKIDEPALLIGPRGRPPDRVLPLSHSFLDDLRDLATRLAQRYSWLEPQAAWFIVTDQPPEYAPALIDLLSARPPTKPDGMIVLRLRPWVSQSSVRRIYKSCQRFLLGRRCREVSEQKLELFEFVRSRKPSPPARPNWPSLFRLWRNGGSSRRTAPPWTWRQFQRDYVRVTKMLMPLSFDRGADKSKGRGRRTKGKG